MIDDIVVGFEDAVREPVIAHELPKVFDWIEFWRLCWQWQDRYIFWHDEIVRQVPTRLVHDEDGMGVIGNMAGYLDQMLVHGMRIAPRHDEGCGLAKLRAYRTEDIRRPCPLIVGSRWPCSPFRPSPGDLVLLTDAGFILEPNFYLLAFGGPASDFSHCRGEVFLNSSIAAGTCA